MDFKNLEDAPPSYGSGGGGCISGDFGLVQQPSVISLTFEEFQNSMGGLRKDFGSMNMEELLKNIWTAEESQGTATATNNTATSSFFGGGQLGNLHRQGSLTLPRTLSQKTVDEVWRELFKESEEDGSKDECGASLALQPQRQPTLGEMTLEEFLAKAGIVKEDAPSVGRQESNGLFAELLGASQSSGLSLGFGQPNRTNVVQGNQVIQSMDTTLPLSLPLPIPIQPPNVSGIVRASQPQQFQPQQRQLFPKQANIAFSHTPLPSEGTGGGIMGTGAQSSDDVPKNNGETSSLSPVFEFRRDVRGRRGNQIVDKVVERRQRRMIKNRESAARSRARKQAVTLELEEAVAKLKQQNEELKRKQEEIMDIQKNQVLTAMIQQKFAKKIHLRRTLTGPW